ncbi:MAG: hypothetical protein IKP40_13630 [Clostridia bacterium]|nr:hypothetical protein [Clostridia bacterium]
MSTPADRLNSLTDAEAIRLVDECGCGMTAILNALGLDGYNQKAGRIWYALPNNSVIKAELAREWLREHPDVLEPQKGTTISDMLRLMDEMERRFHERLEAWKREMVSPRTEPAD